MCLSKKLRRWLGVMLVAAVVLPAGLKYGGFSKTSNSKQVTRFICQSDLAYCGSTSSRKEHFNPLKLLSPLCPSEREPTALDILLETKIWWCWWVRPYHSWSGFMLTESEKSHHYYGGNRTNTIFLKLHGLLESICVYQPYIQPHPTYLSPLKIYIGREELCTIGMHG